MPKDAFSIFVVIKITVDLNECECVANASPLGLYNSIPNSGWTALYFVFYAEKNVNLKSFTFL